MSASQRGSTSVLLFAGLRQRIGREAISVAVEGRISARELLVAIAREHPALAPWLPACRVAVDEAFVDADTEFASDAEIALIPPVSGGHDGPATDGFVLTHEALSPARVVASVVHERAGAVVTFEGNVRGESHGHEVRHLEYEAYDGMALRELRRIGEDIARAMPGVRVAIHHRLGRLEVGETAVFVAASAPHRPQAFDACREAIERLKRDVPIWKREVRTDGSEWLGQGP